MENQTYCVERLRDEFGVPAPSTTQDDYTGQAAAVFFCRDIGFGKIAWLPCTVDDDGIVSGCAVNLDTPHDSDYGTIWAKELITWKESGEGGKLTAEYSVPEAKELILAGRIYCGGKLVEPVDVTSSFDVNAGRRKEGNRSVSYVWDLDEGTNDMGRPCVLQAVLSISHDKAGANHFTGERTFEDHFGVSLSHQEASDGMVSFGLFQGLGLTRIPAGNRYSAKKLREAEAEAVAMFRELVEEGHPKVGKYLAARLAPKA